MFGKLFRASKEVTEQLAALDAERERILAEDRRREPKLTNDEKAQIAALENRIAFLAPKNAKLKEQLAVRSQRRTTLAQNSAKLVLEDGADIDDLADEYARLAVSVEITQKAFDASYVELEQAHRNIGQIKRIARQREG